MRDVLAATIFQQCAYEQKSITDSKYPYPSQFVLLTRVALHRVGLRFLRLE